MTIAVGMTGHPKQAEQVSTPSPDLPPLTLTLDRDLPDAATAAANAEAQISVLQNIAVTDNTPAAWVDLGAARHYQGDYPGAVLDYQRALALDPSRLDAQVGLLMVEAATDSGRRRAASAFTDLARKHPDSQLVAFNQGMVAVYRKDAAGALAAFARVRKLGATTPLGRVARRLETAAAGNTSNK